MGFLDFLIKKEAKKIIDSMDKPKKESPKEQEQGLRQRLESVIAEEWSGYELRKNVSPAEIDAEEKARKISYALYQDGQLKAVMMVLNNRNHYRRSDVVKVKEACRSKQIPYMNFMSYLPSRREYISERLKEEIIG